MKTLLLALLLCCLFSLSAVAQTMPAATTATHSRSEQTLIDVSAQKWQWMADKNVDKLAVLFDDKARFVHMSGTWKKAEELDIIKTGSIWYKQATVHDVAVELFGNTGLVWSRITLVAIVRGAEVKTEFTVTETFQKRRNNWTLLALTFSSVRDTHVIKH
ncbi:hypothetical protein GCM10027578_35720 [Spirosoma luteolum]